MSSANDLRLLNGTALKVTLVVNGQRVGDYAPGGPATIDVDTLPPLPWAVEARSPSGRTLVMLQVRAGDGQTDSGIGQFVDLSCGRLWLWVGDIFPEAPRPTSPGTSGDCST